jgi:hypothetical protein
MIIRRIGQGYVLRLAYLCRLSFSIHHRIPTQVFEKRLGVYSILHARNDATL